jgi:NMD protein affecting ribosome stability and mRNA decay
MVEKKRVCKKCGKTLAPTDRILCHSCWEKIGKGVLTVGGTVMLAAVTALRKRS